MNGRKEPMVRAERFAAEANPFNARSESFALDATTSAARTESLAVEARTSTARAETSGVATEPSARTDLACAGARCRVSILWLAGIAAGAWLLRLYRLGFESLHMDELVTVATYPRGMRDLVASAAVVGQPPLDNFLGAALYRLGLWSSDWWVRFPAASFGAASVFLLGWWVTRLEGAVAGVATAALLAVCPLHVVMSQEARPYALTFFLSLLSVVAYSRARERGGTTSWVMFSTATFLLLMARWTDPHFVVLGIVLHSAGAWALARREVVAHARAWRCLRSTSLSLVAAYGAYAFFFWIVLIHSNRAIGGGASRPMEQMSRMLTNTFTATFAGYSQRMVYLSQPGESWLLVMSLILAALGLGILCLRSRFPGESWLFLCAFLPYPVAYSMVYVSVATAIPKPQYLLPMAIPVFAGIGVAVNTLGTWAGRRRRRLGPVACVLSTLVMLIPMAEVSYAGLQRVDNRDWRGVMRFLGANAQLGDVAATLASDTLPPIFVPMEYGRSRYGAKFLKFVPVRSTTSVDDLSAEGWRSTENTVWLLVYTDRMYLGFDQVPPPTSAADVDVHVFEGLFVIGVRGDRPAMDRLVEGMEAIYGELPQGRMLVMPAILAGRIALARGDADGAMAWFERARRQCRTEDEIEFLERELAPLTARVAATAASGASGP